MKKIILTFIVSMSLVLAHAQCNSNPISNNGASGTVIFSDSSNVDTSFSNNYTVSYLWDFRDGTTSTQQNPCHTYGDLSNVTSSYVTLSVTYTDVATSNTCQDTDSVQVIILMNPCIYGNLQISASGTNLSADWTYNVGGSAGCANNYPDTYLWSNGDTTQIINVSSPGSYTCTVTTTTGCLYTSTYSYNGSLIPTFDCNLIDFNELNNSQDTLTISSNYLNNNFPEVIDSLSFWEAYSTDGNVNLLAALSTNPVSFINIGGFNGALCDTFIVCANVFLYDSLYQHNLWASPPLGSSCNTCDTIAWDGTTWNISSPQATYDCDPVIGCYTNTSGSGAFTSLTACNTFCASTWQNSYCDSLVVDVVSFTADSITLGTNLLSQGYTGSVAYEWEEWSVNGAGVFNPTQTVANPTFSFNQNDTVLYILEMTLVDNMGITFYCIYPALVYWDNGQYVVLRTSEPSQPTSIFNESITTSKKLIKITDLLGRETDAYSNQILLFIYDDGSIEKKYIVK